MFPGHGEHVSDSGGTDADEPLEKLGPGNGNERDVGFSGRGLRQQGLAGSRRAFKGQKVVRLVLKCQQFKLFKIAFCAYI